MGGNDRTGAVLSHWSAPPVAPAQHWSARTPFDRNRALWGAFVIETKGGNIYYAGDTGYGGGDHYRTTRSKFGKFRLALLPIGAYAPRWFMSSVTGCHAKGPLLTLMYGPAVCCKSYFEIAVLVMR